MTRRIVVAILVIVWLALIAAGASTYFITRTLVLADLDETILARIASLPELERPGALPGAPPDTGDRWRFLNPADRSIHGPAATPSTAANAPLTIQSAAFTELDGRPLRTLTVRAFLKRADPLEALFPVTVVYSASTERMDTLLRRLLYSLAGFGIVAALGTTLAARSVARAALKPMREAVQIIETIDEQSLDQRIDVQRLPPELAPMGARLNDLLARLEIAFAQRKQFLADASHELRTPVAALVTTLEVGLARRRDPADYVRTLERCLTDARLLNRLVVGLLEQVRSQRAAANLANTDTPPRAIAAPAPSPRELAPVPLSSILGQCVEMVRAMAEVKGITLRREIQDVLLLTDEAALRSMVTNLLSNAVEYTPAGGAVTVQASLQPDDRPPAQLAPIPESMPSAPCRLLVRITDDGPGIPREHQAGIFEPFYRVDAARAQEHHLGLGLALVQSHARSLGGTCTLESPTRADPAPHGSAFVINIPVVELKPPFLSPENNSAPQPTTIPSSENPRNPNHATLFDPSSASNGPLL